MIKSIVFLNNKMVILVSNIATNHCHHLVTREYREKKRPTVISSALAYVFASLAFVYASPLAFFGFAPVFLHFAHVFFGASPANSETDHVTAYSLPAQAAIDPLTHGYNLSQVKFH